MAFKRSNFAGQALDEAHIEMPKVTTTAFAIGDVLAWSRSSNALTRAVAATDSQGTNCYFGISVNAPVAATAVCNVLPLAINQLYVADCNANTAAGQVGQRCRLTNQATLDNDGSDGNSSSHIFEIIKLIGAASDRKVIVRVLSAIGQVSA